MRTFDLFGDLPAPASTTVLEASAGTGKTFVLAALVTRYLAEGVASLDEMLLITFSRAATQELRERVRGQLLEALEALEERARCRVSGAAAPEPANDLIAHLGGGDTEQILWRAANLRRALADFDAATIATTHQFCQVVLKSLGVAGDNDPGVTLVDSLDALTAEIVDDVYLARFGRQQPRPPLSRDDALALAREAVANPGAAIRPLDPPAGSDAAVRVDFVRRVLAELEPRKRRLRIQGYDDLLGRLAQALEPPEAPARARMRRRWRIVMVDEFQDTDPIQWQVIERAFSGTCTLVLIGDPKQAIYAFRGGDIATYLTAAHTAGTRQTLATNWRSDRALVDALHAVLRDTELGDPDIVVRDVTARRDDHRLAGAPHNAPFRLRVVRRDHFGRDGTDLVPIGELRDYIPRDLAADLAELLGSGATFAGRALTAGDVAVIVENHRDARACRDALGRAGIPCVYYGDSDVFASPAAADWLCLLEAMEQTHRSAMVRAAALTMFFGETAQSLAAGGEAHTDRIATTLREWADHARQHGAAAVFESANLAGMGSRVLAAPGGERNMTDLAHLSQLLQEAAHRDRLSLPALAELLRSRGTPKDGDAERSRRLDSESAAVQIMTVWASKGQQFPLVYLPFAFNRYVADRDCVLYHDPDGTRCVHVGGKRSPDFGAVSTRGAAESAGEALRFAYVALTRAQSQVIAWWAPTRDEVHGGLSRLLRGRSIGAARVPDQCTDTVTDEAALQCFSSWEAAGGPSVEDAVPAADLLACGCPPRALLSLIHISDPT
ncbi:UvrD-helicase domain-containing protein, partial [Mycolicibacterium palauense]|uniref:UvrD-helicase domain-containing protein n=1 Tax=Mycolicibacterium palauense TaxID=2034511 RepID=UPI00114593F9